MIKHLIYFAPVLLIILCSAGCEDENYVPKPPTYLRLEIPKANYETFTDDCPYTFEISSLYDVQASPEAEGLTCHKRIDLGPLNGMAYIRYWDLNGEKPLSFFINGANDEIDRHQLKADNIDDWQIKRPDERVFGTAFELQGDVATPFQFYLTDSTTKFLYCEVLFNSTPNYDSLKPTLDYFRKDLDHLLETFEWKNNQ